MPRGALARNQRRESMTEPYISLTALQDRHSLAGYASARAYPPQRLPCTRASPPGLWWLLPPSCPSNGVGTAVWRCYMARASVTEGGVVFSSWGWGLSPFPSHPGGTGESHLGLRGDFLAHAVWRQGTDLTGPSSRPWCSPAGPLEHLPG